MSDIIVDIPEAFEFLLQPMRYKSAYGGRGRGASWSFARALAAKASYEKLRILCTREYQNSIKDSVYKLLTDQIEQTNLIPYYDINKTGIYSSIGSEFLFKGLQHPLEIKSIEGIDIVWLEEAQNTTEDSWKFLIPTIRKDNSEIWMSWNTGSAEDPTYQRFVTNKPEECISKLLTYKDNPYFPETLRKEMEYCKKVDYDAYLHIWEGKPEKLSHALVFKDKFIIEDFETPYGVKFYYGADWGFANDPIALVRSFIVGKDLFIDYEACGVGVEFEEIPELFDTVPGSREHEIPADSSRPETISYVKRQGFLVKPCTKAKTTKAGFVKGGIAFLKKFEKIHIHTRCKHVKDEFEHYSYKTDKKSGEVLPILLDSFNHCFIGNTKIATINGEVKIKDIQVGDLVLTRYGYRKVKTVWNNGYKEVSDYQFANNRILTGTNTHKIITATGEKILKKINKDDQLFFLEREGNEWKFVKTKNTMRSYLKAFLLSAIKISREENVFPICILMKEGKQKTKDFIKRFGKSIMEKSLKGFASTIKMVIPSMTILPIWSACLEGNIRPCIPQNTIPTTKLKLEGIFVESENMQQHGIKAKKADQLIVKQLKRDGLISNVKNIFASNVVKNTKDIKRENFAQTNVRLDIEDYQGLTKLKGLVLFVRLLFELINTQISLLVGKNAGQHLLTRIEKVYNLEIEEHHEYFANGILVANCIDALRYSLEDLIQNQVTDWERVVNE